MICGRVPAGTIGTRSIREGYVQLAFISGLQLAVPHVAAGRRILSGTRINRSVRRHPGNCPTTSEPVFGVNRTSMRVHEGNFAYDIEPTYEPHTLVAAGWCYRVFALRPERELISGKARTQQEPVRKGRKEVERLNANRGFKRAA
jgi:hypothetical protein